MCKRVQQPYICSIDDFRGHRNGLQESQASGANLHNWLLHRDIPAIRAVLRAFGSTDQRRHLVGNTILRYNHHDKWLVRRQYRSISALSRCPHGKILFIEQFHQVQPTGQVQLIPKCSSGDLFFVRKYLKGLKNNDDDTTSALLEISKLSIIYDKLCCIVKDLNGYFGVHVRMSSAQLPGM